MSVRTPILTGGVCCASALGPTKRQPHASTRAATIPFSLKPSPPKKFSANKIDTRAAIPTEVKLFQF
jgi:hypothetical protein